MGEEKWIHLRLKLVWTSLFCHCIFRRTLGYNKGTKQSLWKHFLTKSKVLVLISSLTLPLTPPPLPRRRDAKLCLAKMQPFQSFNRFNSNTPHPIHWSSADIQLVIPSAFGELLYLGCIDHWGLAGAIYAQPMVSRWCGAGLLCPERPCTCFFHSVGGVQLTTSCIASLHQSFLASW